MNPSRVQFSNVLSGNRQLAHQEFSESHDHFLRGNKVRGVFDQRRPVDENQGQ